MSDKKQFDAGAAMIEHDPLCPHDTHPFPATCETCDLLARVRADERKQSPPRIRPEAYRADERARVLADLRAKVEALGDEIEVPSTPVLMDTGSAYILGRAGVVRVVLAIIDGSGHV